jgi:hypothetical protein
MIFLSTSKRGQLDVYLPELMIAFEYQGEQHYGHTTLNLIRQDAVTQQRRDKEKEEACKELGITLITVPYWWDGKVESLQSTIRRKRFDLLTDVAHTSPEIPQSPNKPVKESLELLNLYEPQLPNTWAFKVPEGFWQ